MLNHTEIISLLWYDHDMRVLLQRVKQASVSIDGILASSIQAGYLLFLCMMNDDSEEDTGILVEKILHLRLFEGVDGKINDQTIVDVKGEILLVSQFTLAANLQKGNRPDYTAAAPAAMAKIIYDQFLAQLKTSGLTVESGTFGADMDVTLINDGPVTLLLDTKTRL